MADDPHLREMTCDPKFRRVLITDGRTAVGQAMAKAFSDAGASIVFVGLADPWKPFPGMGSLRKIERVEIVPLDVTDTESGYRAGRSERRPHRHCGQHRRTHSCRRCRGSSWPDDRARGDRCSLSRPAAACAGVRPDPSFSRRGRCKFGRGLRQSAVGACADELARIRELFRDRGGMSVGGAMHARGTAPGRVKVLNVFFGPLEIEWFQTVPPPKVTPATLANAVVRALQHGLEDVFVGDVAEDIRQRLAVNPKALERETGKLKGISMTVDLMSFARAVANGDIRVIDLHADAVAGIPDHCAAARAWDSARRSEWRKCRATTSADRPGTGTTLVSASILERTSTRRFTGFPARICPTTQSIRSMSRSSSRRLP